MEDKPDVVLCGLRLLFPPNSTDASRPAGKVQSVGHTIDLRGEVLHPFMGWSADNPKTTVSGYRVSVTGASFMVRRGAFRAIQGFSEEYGTGYFEDVEMCLRLGAAGGKIYVDTNAVAYHYVGATFIKRDEGNSFQQNKLKFRDRNRTLISWTDWTVR
jgi:GT2 family glycosyltransferase